MSTSNKKVVLVTGAGQGIGRAIANHFHTQGYQVVATDYNATILEDLKGVEGYLTAKHNVASIDDAKAVAQQIKSELGRLDIIVNNAGINAYLPVVEVNPQRIVDGFMVNTLGPLFNVNACLDLLIESKGTVVNISSESATFRAPFQFYQSTKQALECLSDVMRRELGIYDVHVVTVRPGAIATEMTDTSKVPVNPVENSRFDRAFKNFCKELVASMPKKKFTVAQAAEHTFKAATDPSRPVMYKYNNLFKFKVIAKLPAKFLDTQIVKLLKS